MRDMSVETSRIDHFIHEYGLSCPILLAPMAGACPPELSAAVANAGGMGACGALLMPPSAIAAWADKVRSASKGPFMMNIWVPDPAPNRSERHEASLARYLSFWGPEVPKSAADVTPPDFDAQFAAMVDAAPLVISSIMGLFSSAQVEKMKSHNIKWFATVTTVNEAQMAVAAGADAVIAQGAEAGGHRGSFYPEDAERDLIGLFSLLPAVVDAVDVPVIATGGIGDARGIAAALILGASAVQMGTAFLRSPEAGIPATWADALGTIAPEDTIPTRAYSGRLGRAIRTPYVEDMMEPATPDPAPYPIQRNLTAAMRAEAVTQDDLVRMQAWAGQSARLGANAPAAELIHTLWDNTKQLLKH